MNNLCLEEFEKNLKRIRFNENNKDISKKLDDLSIKIKLLSEKLKNNMNTDEIVVVSTAPAGHTRPIRNNTHSYFNSTLRRFW